MYSRSRLNDRDLRTIVMITNRVWLPYGVKLESATGPDSIVVVVSGRSLQQTWFGPTVLGTTMFVEGHAKGNVQLSLDAAEALAAAANMTPLFSERPLPQRDEMLVRMLGVALAHELGHYLLDTMEHSSAGLLQQVLSVRDMQSVDLSHLGLTDDQQRRVCLPRSPAGRDN